MLTYDNYCIACGKSLKDGEQVAALVLVDVEEIKDGVRLKLSSDGINKRALSVYCKECMDWSAFIGDE